MERIHLERGRTRCTIVPAVGGRLHQLEIQDAGSWLPLLLSPDDMAEAAAQPMASGSFALVPWPNRIKDGVFEFDGKRYKLERNHNGDAIHGFGFRRPWTVDDVSATACVLSLAFDAAWPFGGRSLQEFTLNDDSIMQRVELHATDQPFPAGIAWHPYFRRDVRPGSEPRVQVLADEMYELDDMISTGRILPVSGEADLRNAPELGERLLDHCYRDVRSPMRIRWGDIELTMEQSANQTHAVVYTASQAFCVEPQTCAIDAFNLEASGTRQDTGMAVVAPGNPLIATTTWRWHA